MRQVPGAFGSEVPGEIGSDHYVIPREHDDGADPEPDGTPPLVAGDPARRASPDPDRPVS